MAAHVRGQGKLSVGKCPGTRETGGDGTGLAAHADLGGPLGAGPFLDRTPFLNH